MDTGLAEGIPRFHIEQLQLRNLDDNSLMAELELYEPISENPLLSFDVGAVNGVTLKGHDNNANTFAADLVNP
jgi:sulfur-oxidizing protein SoxY